MTEKKKNYRITMLNGSIRKKHSYNLLKSLSNHFPGADIEVLNIKDYSIKHCVGCENCVSNGMCNIKDDKEQLQNKLIEADGIVIASPVYLRQISGTLKVFIDRCCSWYHRSPLVGKPILFALATQVSGLKQAEKYLKDLSVQWGTIHCGTFSSTVFSRDKDFSKKALNRFLGFLNSENLKFYRPSLKEIVEFQTQKVLAIQVITLDRTYWTEKGYIKQPFFYKCRISLFKRMIGAIYFSLLNRIIVKNKVS